MAVTVHLRFLSRACFIALRFLRAVERIVFCALKKAKEFGSLHGKYRCAPIHAHSVDSFHNEVHADYHTWGALYTDLADCQTVCTEPGLQCLSAMLKTDGEFGDWGAWSQCSTTCGGGMQWRQRLCNSPPPLSGGADCFAVDMGLVANASINEEITLAIGEMRRLMAFAE